MSVRWLVLLALGSAVAIAQSAAAPNNSQTTVSGPPDCPWLPAGAAAAALGGKISIRVHLDAVGQGSCTFENELDHDQQLEITVAATSPELCKAGTSLEGVANWAKQCENSAPGDFFSESIVGQARDHYFTATLTIRLKENKQSKNATLQTIAQLVAGSLY